VVLGDVAGKGLGAALLMAKLQATLRAILPDVASLAELGARVNTILHRDGLDNRFATLFLAELDHGSGRLRYLNAGHNPACVIRHGGVERLDASSYPLGLLAQASYQEGAVELSPGELLLAYSDGLTEATNEAGEEFGAQRLEQLLPSLRGLAPAAAGARVLAEVARFVGERRPDDDLSLAVIARR
jgi:sigma-B regulation protein RsbU (phosphoserine phosphatase)